MDKCKTGRKNKTAKVATSAKIKKLKTGVASKSSASTMKSSTLPYRRQLLFPLGENKFMIIRKMKNLPYVNIRSYSKDEHGRLFATNRGILLSPKVWAALKSHTASMDDQLRLHEIKTVVSKQL